VQDTLEGLSYVHQRGVIHDDVKPDNILMQSPEREDEYPIAKLCDFGLSLRMDSDGKAQQEVKCGTPGYIAPEITSVGHLFYSA